MDLLRETILPDGAKVKIFRLTPPEEDASVIRRMGDYLFHSLGSDNYRQPANDINAWRLYCLDLKAGAPGGDRAGARHQPDHLHPTAEGSGRKRVALSDLSDTRLRHRSDRANSRIIAQSNEVLRRNPSIPEGIGWNGR